MEIFMSSAFPKQAIFLLILILVATAMTAIGCAMVQPYQRGNLADPIMQFDYDELGAGYDAKFFDTREGATGGGGGAKGGCGCK
jgi:Domain of unknown function (DUF4266)